MLFPGVLDYHLDFQLRSSRHPDLVFSRHQSMHLLELPKFQHSAGTIANPLDAWCYFLIHGAELDAANLPPTLRIAAVEKAMEVLTMVAQNDLERQRYESRIKAERDRRMYILDAEEKGEKKGEEKGEIIGAIRALQQMMKVSVTPREALLALAVDELKAELTKLQQQAGLPGTA